VCGVEEEQSLGALLLADIRAMFGERRADKIASAELVEALAAIADRPWPECRHGKPINQNWLARRLAEFGIRAKKIRPAHGKPAQGYELAAFQDSFVRYLPETGFQSGTVEQSNKINSLDENQTGTRAVPFQNCAKSLKTQDCYSVPVQNPQFGENANVPAPEGPKVGKNAAGGASWRGQV
jgi:Protein of unknown function (DUF3631)